MRENGLGRGAGVLFGVDVGHVDGSSCRSAARGSGVAGRAAAGCVTAAAAAKEGCPVSKALTGTTISLDAGLK